MPESNWDNQKSGAPETGSNKAPASKSESTEPSWLSALRKREQPLSLSIDEQGQIEFWKYSFEGTHDYNLMAWHPEGDLDFGFDELTRRERYGLDTTAFKRSGYGSRKARTIESLERFGNEHLLKEGIPWPDSEQGLDGWLDACPSENEFPEPFVSEWDNQYRPSHPIHDALTPKEREVLGISQNDAGGPASGGCMVTTVNCSMDELNEVIRKKKLPFVVVEDKRFEKPSHSVLSKK